MKKSVRITIWALCVLAAVLAVLVLIVSFSGNVYKNDVQKTLDYSAEDIWAVLVNLQGVEVIESDELGPLKWRQNLADGGFAIFERWQFDVNRNYVVKMVNSSFGMTGLFAYELIPYNAQSTLVKMSMETELTGFWDSVKVGIFGMEITLGDSIENLEKTLADKEAAKNLPAEQEAKVLDAAPISSE